MTAHREDPDDALARWLASEDERYLREGRMERLEDYTPTAFSRGLQGSADAGHGSGHRAGASGGRTPGVTSAMVSLAYTVLHGSSYDARDASKVLAELVLEAGS